MGPSTRSWFSPLVRWTIAIVSCTAVTLAGITGLGPAPAAAQAPASAALARRLAEVADGLRDGRAHWIVANPRLPHQISGIYLTGDSARADSMIARGDYAVYGPFLTEIDFGLPDQIVLITCSHRDNPVPSTWRIAYCPTWPIPVRIIREMLLIVRTPTDTIRVDLLREGIDALFFSVSSIDKFVVPYYSRLYGPAYGQAIRDSLALRVRSIIR